MGFLNNAQISVDAVLTKVGRQYIASNDPKFKITKFALADDGVDYGLYDTDHPSGSSEYGAYIEAMPTLEAISDESQTMKYKLITLPKGTPKIPIISATPSAIAGVVSNKWTINPSTTNSSIGFDNATYGYTVILTNDLICTLETDKRATGQVNANSLLNSFDDNNDETTSVSAVGLSFTLTAKYVNDLSDSNLSGKLIIIGNETGGIFEIPITISKS